MFINAVYFSMLSNLHVLDINVYTIKYIIIYTYVKVKKRLFVCTGAFLHLSVLSAEWIN